MRIRAFTELHTTEPFSSFICFALPACDRVQVWGYFRVLFDFVDRELGGGRSVLVHCLAGAHRAGTAGTACLMHLCRLESKDAVRAKCTQQSN